MRQRTSFTANLIFMCCCQLHFFYQSAIAQPSKPMEVYPYQGVSLCNHLQMVTCWDRIVIRFIPKCFSSRSCRLDGLQLSGVKGSNVLSMSSSLDVVYAFPCSITNRSISSTSFEKAIIEISRIFYLIQLCMH